MVIRTCNRSDGEALFCLFEEWDRSRSYDKRGFLDSLALVLDDPSIHIIVAEEGGAIVGYAHSRLTRKLGQGVFLELDQLLVAETKRSTGIGKALMEEVERIALSKGVRIVSLYSQAHRSRAHVFYERLGYELTKISKYYEKRLHDR